ncbi:MAG: transketolase [Pirellulales bacterium]
MPQTASDIAQLSINTIRTLAMDAVEAANSGHPGTPMALAPVTYQLWTQHLRYDPSAPYWPNRDRYILSCGHASMLLYAMIHLAGVRRGKPDGTVREELSLPLEEIKNFRQWGSRTPGHPEYGAAAGVDTGHATGVETTTGPLGQGCGNSVGMAIAGRWLGARYNRPGFELFNYRVWTQCSDGDLMEGVGCEAASLAGHLKLGNLCWIYDDNHITIEGSTKLAFSEDVKKRFEGLGWNVLRVADANDLKSIEDAFERASSHSAGPTMIIVTSVIGFGAPKKAGTAKAHGEALGAEEVAAAKTAYGWPTDAKFLVPPEVPKHFQATLGERGRKTRQEWEQLFARYEKEHPEQAAELKLIQLRGLPKGWQDAMPKFDADPKGMATRISSGTALNAFAQRIPWLLGGSADLAPSTKTLLTFDGAGGDLSAENPGGRNLHYGVREHAMAAAVNGMTLCGLRAYGATFFVFTDYMRPALRLGAIMGLPTIMVLTHDSIGVGEDGPTHQPIEHLAACRAIPNMIVLRPGDANETAVAWRVALEQTKKSVLLILTRQNLPTFDRKTYASAEGVVRGGYVMADAPNREPEVILMATGSEVQLVVKAHEILTKEGIRSRVVSLPSFELFEAQSIAYREDVLPPWVTARVAVEAGCRQCWDRYLGPTGAFVGLDTFGASAPFEKVYEHRGLTVDAVVAKAREVANR